MAWEQLLKQLGPLPHRPIYKQGRSYSPHKVMCPKDIRGTSLFNSLLFLSIPRIFKHILSSSFVVASPLSSHLCFCHIRIPTTKYPWWVVKATHHCKWLHLSCPTNECSSFLKTYGHGYGPRIQHPNPSLTRFLLLLTPPLPQTEHLHAWKWTPNDIISWHGQNIVDTQ